MAVNPLAIVYDFIPSAATLRVREDLTSVKEIDQLAAEGISSYLACLIETSKIPSGKLGRSARVCS